MLLDDIKNVPIEKVAKALKINVKNHKAFCFKGHDNKTPSLSFRVTHNTFKCFGCGIGGTTLDLVMLHENLDIPKAKDWFENKFEDLEKVEYKKSLLTLKKDKDYSGIYKRFVSLLPNVNENSYLVKERKLNLNILNDNDIKFINKNYKEILVKYYTEEVLLNSGLLTKNDSGKIYFSFWDCDYIFPFYKDNKVIYLQGVFKDRSKKYKNLKGRSKPLLYIPKTFKDKEGLDVIVSEGVITCLSGFSLGHYNSVGFIDANVSSGLNEFCFLRDKKVLLSADMDQKGFEAVTKILKYMKKSGFDTVEILDYAKFCKKLGVSVSVDMKDLNDILKKLKECC